MNTKKNDEVEGKEDVTTGDLQKSLDKLEEVITTDNPVARKEELLAKAKEGDLEKSERDELYTLMGGAVETDPVEPTVGEDLIKSMTDTDNEGLQDALDVSPYLREQHSALVKALEAVGEHIEQSDKRQHEHSLMQSAAIVEMGHLVKSLAERLGVIENQPARGPKTRGVGGPAPAAQPLSKSFEGDEEGGEQLTKSQIADALDGIMAESMEKGNKGLTEKGEDILLEISKFDQMSKLSPSMFAEVKGYISRRGAAN